MNHLRDSSRPRYRALAGMSSISDMGQERLIAVAAAATCQAFRAAGTYVYAYYPRIIVINLPKPYVPPYPVLEQFIGVLRYALR